MFKRKVQTIDTILNRAMRDGGLETPLLQRRLMESWDDVAGSMVSRYTEDRFIRNQTLFVKISNPALRANLNMMRTELMQKLNAKVGAFIISEIRFV